MKKTEKRGRTRVQVGLHWLGFARSHTTAGGAFPGDVRIALAVNISGEQAENEDERIAV